MKYDFDPADPFANIDESEFLAEMQRPSRSAAKSEATVVELYRESCKRCGGTGTYRAPSQYGSHCFACKGKGVLVFKTSPEMRAKGRKSAAASKARKADERKAAFSAWLDARPVVREWLTENAANSFAQSLVAGGVKYGALTEGQERAVLNAIARDADKAEGLVAWKAANSDLAAWLDAEAANGNQFAGSLLNAVKRYGSLTPNQEAAVKRNIDKAKENRPSDLDLSELPSGYYAVPNGETRLKIRVKRPGANSQWQGWIYVDDGAAYGHNQLYGKQAPGAKYSGKVQEQLRAILANPIEAMKAYGHLTGQCGRCGRMLEDEESVAAGIGPICAGKM